MGCYHNLNYFIQIGDKIGKPIAKTMFCLEIALEHVVDQLSPVCVHTVMLYSAQTVVLCDHLRQKVFEIGFRSCLCQPLLNINRISKVCQELQWRWLLFLCSGVPQFLVGHIKQGDGKGMVRWCWMGKNWQNKYGLSASKFLKLCKKWCDGVLKWVYAHLTHRKLSKQRFNPASPSHCSSLTS